MTVFETVVHRNVDNWKQSLAWCVLAQTTHSEIVGELWQLIHIRNSMSSF